VHCALDPRAVKFETWQAWVTAMQTGSALFAAATAPEGTSVTCRIKERERVLPATGMESHLNAGAWVTAFYLAMICRDNDRLRRLAGVPVSLLRESGAVFDEYIYSWVEALQSFWLGRQDVGDKLVAAVDGTSPEARRHADAGLMSKILYPPTLMLYRILRRDSAEFGKALADALRRHRSIGPPTRTAQPAPTDSSPSAHWPWPASPATRESRWTSSPSACPRHCWNTPGSARSSTDRTTGEVGSGE
jgi:hypothetical protein